MANEKYYIIFPGPEMKIGSKPVLFEVVEENDETLIVKLLEDPPFLEGLEARTDLPKAGHEFRINRTHRGGKDILAQLRSGNVVAYYRDTLEEPNKEFYFRGTLFPYEHPTLKR